MFTTQLDMELESAVYDLETGLLTMTFANKVPADEPNPANWRPNKRYKVAVRPFAELGEEIVPVDDPGGSGSPAP